MSRTRFTTRLDVSSVLAELDDGAETGVRHAVEHLLTEANKHVPHDEGTLERSGDTGVAVDDDGVSGSVSYDTPYAVVQHEDLTFHHKGKGQAKWLETAFAEEADAVRDIIATRLRGGLS